MHMNHSQNKILFKKNTYELIFALNPLKRKKRFVQYVRVITISEQCLMTASCNSHNI